MSKGGISTQLTQLHIEMQWDRIDWRFDHQQWMCSLVINNDKLDKPTIDRIFLLGSTNSMITYKMQILLDFRSNMNQPGMTTTATCWFLLASIHSSTHYLGLSKKSTPKSGGPYSQWTWQFLRIPPFWDTDDISLGEIWVFLRLAYFRRQIIWPCPRSTRWRTWGYGTQMERHGTTMGLSERVPHWDL